nr:hypothetical protein [Longimicrobium terrae]
MYAWDRIRDADTEAVSRRGYTRYQDLFAHVLADSVTPLVTRGLDRGYQLRSDEVAGVRGRLDLGSTLRSNLHSRGRTRCEFDELTDDVLHNRIVRATIRLLLDTELDDRNRKRLRVLDQRMGGVSHVRVTGRDLTRVQLHGNNSAYDFALGICRIVHDNLLVGRGGALQFRGFQATPQQMGSLFEAFIFNFLKREQSAYDPTRPHLDWHDAGGTPASRACLPKMKTDLVLQGSGRRIILDCKFYGEPLKSGTVNSSHLYQLLAYLANAAAADGEAAYEGFLLYPMVTERIALNYQLNGFPITIRSLNLNQPWEGIHNELLGMLPPPANRKASAAA